MTTGLEKKVVNRNVAIALGITCIVILAASGGLYLYQASSNSAQITTLQTQVSSLQSQVANLTNIASLKQSTTWKDHYNVTQPSAKSSNSSSPAYSILTFTAGYAGYVNVSVTYSSKPNIYIQVIYTTSYGINYNSTVSLNGVTLPSYAVFPVVPANIQIIVGNAVLGSNAPKTVTETVTIKYCY